MQNTQENKRTLFNSTKLDKTCTFSRKSSFSSYVKHENRKTNNQFNFSSVGWMWEAGGRKRAWDLAWKRGLPRKCARFVLFPPIKKRSFNLLCVLDLVSERWQSTLFQIFFPPVIGLFTRLSPSIHITFFSNISSFHFLYFIFIFIFMKSTR